MSSEDLTLCSVVSLRTNPVDYRPLVQHNLHKIDDTFDARYGVTIWCEGVIDELERLTIASLNNKLREELIEYVANCELPEFYQQEYFNLAHITTGKPVNSIILASTLCCIN